MKSQMIGGAGFARMAWIAAQSRFGFHPDVVTPHPRIESIFMSQSENEYYRICDNASIAFTAFQYGIKVEL